MSNQEKLRFAAVQAGVAHQATHRLIPGKWG
jgi:hypothetical protein